MGDGVGWGDLFYSRVDNMWVPTSIEWMIVFLTQYALAIKQYICTQEMSLSNSDGKTGYPAQDLVLSSNRHPPPLEKLPN